MIVVKTILMLIKRQNSHNIELAHCVSVLGVTTTLTEFIVLETRNTIGKMEERGPVMFILDFTEVIRGFSQRVEK
jgi:hypothetical protein